MTASGALREAIERCTELTDRMLSAAMAGDWQQVAELERLRRDCCGGIRLQGLDADELDSAGERLRALVAMDRRLAGLVDEARARSLVALRAARGQARASAAYQALSFGA
ncbi:MAG: flagellar protein FliT [Pseudomonadales bacterium]